MATRHDRRMPRTRSTLIQAFRRLLLNRRRERIRVADIVDRPGSAGTDLYDQFPEFGDLYVEALSRPFAVLADAAAGQGEPERLKNLLDHFWENRIRVRATLSGRTGDKAARLLAAMVAARLQRRGDELVLPIRLASLQLAQAALAPVRGWVGGEAPCRSSILAKSLCRSSEQLVRALVAPPVEYGPFPRAAAG